MTNVPVSKRRHSKGDRVDTNETSGHARATPGLVSGRLWAVARRLATAASVLLGSSLTQHARAEEGVTADRVFVGSSLALSGPLAAIGKDFAAGMKVAIDQVNAGGGVNGRKLVLTMLDDGYDAKRTVENTKTLLAEGKAFAFLGTLGTANILAAMPLLEERGVPLFAAFSGANSLRKQPYRQFSTVIASYADETERMVNHAHTIGLRRIAVAYQDNPFGLDGLEGVKEALQRRQLVPLANVAVKTDASNAEEAAQAIARAEPQVVIATMAGKATLEFVRNLRRIRPSTQLMLLSVADTNQLTRELGKAADGIIVTQTVPGPFHQKLRISRDFLQAMTAAGKGDHASYAAMTGFIAAHGFSEMLRRSGGSPTRESFGNSLRGGRPIDLGGFELRFGSGQPNGSKYVELTMIRSSGRPFVY